MISSIVLSLFLRLIIIISLVRSDNEDYCSDEENYFDGVLNYPNDVIALTRSLNDSHYKLWFLNTDQTSAVSAKILSKEFHPRNAFTIECDNTSECEDLKEFENTFTLITVDMTYSRFYAKSTQVFSNGTTGLKVKKTFDWDNFFGKYNQNFRPIVYSPKKHLFISVINGKHPSLEWVDIEKIGPKWLSIDLKYSRGMVFVSAFYYPIDQKIYFILESQTKSNESDRRNGFVYEYKHEQTLGWNISQIFANQNKTVKEWFGCQKTIEEESDSSSTKTAMECPQPNTCPPPIPCQSMVPRMHELSDLEKEDKPKESKDAIKSSESDSGLSIVVILLIVGVIAVVIILFFVGIVFLFSRKTQKPENTAENSVKEETNE